MSTPSKRQRTLIPTAADEAAGFETKEEMKNPPIYSLSSSSSSSSSSLPLQLQLQLLSSPTIANTNVNAEAKMKNWFCANTALAKQTCIQRLPQDVENWTTPFSSGLEGGMTAEECEHTCGPSRGLLSLPSSLSSISSLLQSSRVEAKTNPMNLTNPLNLQGGSTLNSLISSMLTPKEVIGVIPTSRANYSGFDAAQKARLYLEAQLTGLVSPSQYYANTNYYLNNILAFLRGQERSVNKFLSYPLLVQYLPSVEKVNPVAFWPLFNQLPRREKLMAIVRVIREHWMGKTALTGLLEQFIATNVFQFSPYEITHDNELTRKLWKLRDIIFANYFFDTVSRGLAAVNSPEFVKVIDWYFELRDQEQSESPSIVRNLDSSAWTSRLSDFIDIRLVPPHSPSTPMERWLSIFLDRGYYRAGILTNQLPESIALRYDPLILSIYLKRDPGTISRIVENDYNSVAGLERINALRRAMTYRMIRPDQFTELAGEGEDEDGDETKIENKIAEFEKSNSTLMFLYNALGDVFQVINDEIPSSQPRPALYIAPVQLEQGDYVA